MGVVFLTGTLKLQPGAELVPLARCVTFGQALNLSEPNQPFTAADPASWLLPLQQTGPLLPPFLPLTCPLCSRPCLQPGGSWSHQKSHSHLRRLQIGASQRVSALPGRRRAWMSMKGAGGEQEGRAMSPRQPSASRQRGRDPASETCLGKKQGCIPDRRDG